MSSSESANALRPQIQELIQMCDPDRFQIHKFFALFIEAKPTKEELKLIVKHLPEEDRLMDDAIELRFWDFALLMAKRDFLGHENNWEYEIEEAHEDNNMPCHLLMSHFGFPQDSSSYEYPTCKLCDKLRTKYVVREEDFATSSDEEEEEVEEKTDLPPLTQDSSEKDKSNNQESRKRKRIGGK
jgi:hypothetical protein